MRLWSETAPEQTRLAASQTPTIPLKLKISPSVGLEVRFMDKARSFFVWLCIPLLAVPSGGFAADKPAGGPNSPDPQKQDNASIGPIPSDDHGWVKRLIHNYRPATVPPPTVANSNRIESLLRAGNLYL